MLQYFVDMLSLGARWDIINSLLNIKVKKIFRKKTWYKPSAIRLCSLKNRLCTAVKLDYKTRKKSLITFM